MPASTIASNLTLVVPDATLYHFGILSSTMHNVWVRYTCGRIKSDFRYSASIVYNNFPWPEIPANKQRAAIEQAAQAVLDARAAHPAASLATLYDPQTMPAAADLVKAHQKLDAAVDAAYNWKGKHSDADRIALLFERYETLIATWNATHATATEVVAATE